MKILGLVDNDYYCNQLIDFTLDKIDCLHKIKTTLNSILVNTSLFSKIDLLIISIPFDYNIQSLKNNIPASDNTLLLICNSQTITKERDKNSLHKQLISTHINTENIFFLDNCTNAFDNTIGLSNIPKRIELCNIINDIQYRNLNLKDNSIRNCGITRDEKEIGDEGGH